MRKALLLTFLLPAVAGLGACSGSDKTKSDVDGGTDMAQSEPTPFCSPAIPPGATPSLGTVDGKSSLALTDSAACTEVTSGILHAEADDIVPAGYVALGKAIAFTGSDGPFPHKVDFTVPADLSTAPDGTPSSRIVVVEKRADGQAAVVPASNITYEAAWKRLHFHAPELGTYQAALPADAGKKVTRHYTFRAIGGVSMGGFGSSVNYFRDPSKYDGIAVMGADPGPDLSYTLGMLRDWFFNGFCACEYPNATATDDGEPDCSKVGQLCPSPRQPRLDEFETAMDFEHLIYQKGDGVGLTLNRSLYTRAFRDLSRAIGNAAYPYDVNKKGEPFVTFLPPGIGDDILTASPAEVCGLDGDGNNEWNKTHALRDYHDYRFNPDGSKPVITFCDGGYLDDDHRGTFDPTKPQLDPTQIMLAVDLNGNGQRDQGEPVLVQGTERWDDCGTDKLCDKDEPGYDAATNPDPNHDNYDWYFNPSGTEGNWRYDEGEHFYDYGVDGVKGTCQLGETPPEGVAGCYDYGEGNGKFDLGPNIREWYAHDPHALLVGYDAQSIPDTQRIAKIPDAQLDRIATYYDAGIRDFLNAQVSTDNLVAALSTRGLHTRVWEGFPALLNLAPNDEKHFDANKLDLRPFGRHVYVRYGDPEVSEKVVEDTGDGRHVGTVTQAIHRVMVLFSFLSNIWPDGDVDTNVGSGSEDDLTFTAQNGRVTPYSVVTPPGYYDEKNATKTYPVVYFLHGYGMDPKGMASAVAAAQSLMVNDNVPADHRMQKMIFVLVDAVCRPGGDVKDGSLQTLMSKDMAGDMCEEGGFYTQHPDGTYAGDDLLAELQAIVEQNYRVKPAADLDAVQ